MINFRYHIVSLIAVFLALAIGVIMGSAVIDRAIVNRLEDQQTSLERRIGDVLAQALLLVLEPIDDGAVDDGRAHDDADGEREEHRDQRHDVVAEVDHRKRSSSADRRFSRNRRAGWLTAVTTSSANSAAPMSITRSSLRTRDW